MPTTNPTNSDHAEAEEADELEVEEIRYGVNKPQRIVIKGKISHD